MHPLQWQLQAQWSHVGNNPSMPVPHQRTARRASDGCCRISPLTRATFSVGLSPISSFLPRHISDWLKRASSRSDSSRRVVSSGFRWAHKPGNENSSNSRKESLMRQFADSRQQTRGYYFDLCANLLTRSSPGWNLTERCIPGRQNIVADQLSHHNHIVPPEWSLLPQVFKEICSLWKTNGESLCKLKETMKCQFYAFPFPNPIAWKEEAHSTFMVPSRSVSLPSVCSDKGGTDWSFGVRRSRYDASGTSMTTKRMVPRPSVSNDREHLQFSMFGNLLVEFHVQRFHQGLN